MVEKEPIMVVEVDLPRSGALQRWKIAAAPADTREHQRRF
jgi:hypothetical protein